MILMIELVDKDIKRIINYYCIPQIQEASGNIDYDSRDMEDIKKGYS